MISISGGLIVIRASSDTNLGLDLQKMAAFPARERGLDAQ